MKMIHTADWHLGFRQYDRLAPNGINQREQDVARAAYDAVTLMIAEQPDVIVIAGDVFHQSRPSNPAIVHAFLLLKRVRDALPNVRIVMVAGNHDAPRTADAGCILQLFNSLGVIVVENSVAELHFPELDLYMMAVPDVVGIERPKLIPTSDRAHRVLLMHGEIAGVVQVRTPHEIDPYDLHAEAWSYIALGHYHVYREVAPRAYYSGSLSFTSTNPWGEMDEQRERGVPGHGFIVQDFATGEHRFVSVLSTRSFVQLPSIDCEGLTVDDINREIRLNVELAGIEEKVVRQVLRNCPRALVRELDSAALREYRARALHFQLDSRKPETAAVALSIGTAEQRTSLTDTFASYLRERAIPADIDRDAFVSLGLRYLQQADEQLAAAPVLEAA